MKYKILLMQILLMASFSLSAKILIITHAFNRPDFIELQYKTFKHFLLDDYEFIVFNDASNKNLYNQIQATCKRLKIQHIPIPQTIHKNNQPGQRHADGIQYSFEQVGYEHNDIVALIDSDMFLLKPFSIRKYLDDNLISGLAQSRSNSRVSVHYIAPSLVFMDMQNLPNKRSLSFEGGRINGLACDIGGHTYYYLQNNSSVKPLYMNQLHIGEWKKYLKCKACNNMTCSNCSNLLTKFDDYIIKFIQTSDANVEFFIADIFLHYRAGSNWNHQSNKYHQQKTQILNQLIDSAIQKYSA